MEDDDLIRWAYNKLEDGLSKQEIKRSLRNAGYGEKAIQGVLKEAANTDTKDRGAEKNSALENWQAYTWLLLFTAFFGAYMYSTLSTTHTNVLFYIVGPGLSRYIIVLILAFQLLSGLYQVFSRGNYDGWWNAASAAVLVGGYMAVNGVLYEFSGTFSQLPSTRDGIFVILWINFNMLAVAAFAVPISWKKFGKFSWLLLAAFLLVFSAGFGLNYMNAQTAIAQLEKAEDKKVLPNVENFFEQSEDPYRHALRYRFILPPLSTEATNWALSEASGNLYVFSKSLQDVGGLGRTLSGPGTFCGGTGENLNDIAGDSFSREGVVAATQLVLEKIRLNRERVIEGFNRSCPTFRDCNPSKFQPVEAYNGFINLVKNRRDVVKNYLQVEEVPKDFVVSNDCSITPKKYQSVKLKNVSCTRHFRAVMENVGTREISSRVTVEINGPSEDLNASLTEFEIANISSWRSGEKVISYPAKFREGRSYRALIVFGDSNDLRVSAYCMGGNGFCKDCGKKLNLDRDLKKRIKKKLEEKPWAVNEIVDSLVDEGYGERYAYRAVKKVEREVKKYG
ncbi:MAG: hypothetical protein SVV03_05155 [Candidatus Nanohaloarchaea archaeon]|nr:hypothetical protein [Candidatus Nanohaloarchaea archaeon]